MKSDPCAPDQAYLDGAQLRVVILGPEAVDECLLSHLAGPHAPDGLRFEALLARPQPLRLQNAVCQLQGSTQVTRQDALVAVQTEVLRDSSCGLPLAMTRFPVRMASQSYRCDCTNC